MGGTPSEGSQSSLDYNRPDFWQDINTKDEEYKDALIIRKVP